PKPKRREPPAFPGAGVEPDPVLRQMGARDHDMALDLDASRRACIRRRPPPPKQLRLSLIGDRAARIAAGMGGLQARALPVKRQARDPFLHPRRQRLAQLCGEAMVVAILVAAMAARKPEACQRGLPPD